MTNLAIWLGLTVLVVAGLAFWYLSGSPAPVPTPSIPPPSAAAPIDQGSFGQEKTAPQTTTPPPAPAPEPVNDSVFKG